MQNESGAGRPFAPYGVDVGSRMLLGTAQYPSPQVLAEAVSKSGAGVVTVSLRRENARGQTGQRFLEFVGELGVHVVAEYGGVQDGKGSDNDGIDGTGVVWQPLGETRSDRE